MVAVLDEPAAGTGLVGLDDRRVVLHVRVVADRGGGPDKTLAAMENELRGSRYRPLVACLHPPGSAGFAALARVARGAGAELMDIADRGPIDPRPLRELLALCRRHRVAIWHAHDYKSAVLGVLLRRRHAMRLVTTLHGWVDLDLRTRLYFAIDRLCLPAFDHVFAVSADLAAAARRRVAAERVSLLHNGIDATHFRRRGTPAGAALRRELGTAPGRLVVATVSRLVPAKGLDVAIDAFARLRSSGVDAELWIAGDGPERDCLERLASSPAIADRVRLLGHHADVRPLLEASDLLLSASWREGTPNALLEALAMEVPVVATAVGGVGELIRDGETGRLCAAGDAAALAAAMRQLLSDAALRARVARRGRRLAEAEYSLAERTRQEIEVYDRLLAEAGA